MTRKITATLLAATAAFVVAAAVADAKVWFMDFNGRMMRWDQRVSTTISGCPGNPSCGDVVQNVGVFIRRGRSRSSTPVLADLRRVGRISRSGRVRFRVPHVPPNSYHLVAKVKLGDSRRWMAVSDTFRIRPR